MNQGFITYMTSDFLPAHSTLDRCIGALAPEVYLPFTPRLK